MEGRIETEQGDPGQSIAGRPDAQPPTSPAMEMSTAPTGDNPGCSRICSMPEPVHTAPASSTKPPNMKRRSTPIAGRKPGKLSAEFDRRYDGPFGRPSLTMVRGRSLSLVRGRSPVRPTLAELSDLEKAEASSGGSGGTETGVPRLATATAVAGRPGFTPEPPSLNYTLRTRKLTILIFWTVIIIDSVFMPIGLYFGLWYGVGPGTNTPTEIREKLSANAVFSIVTAAIGGASIVEYFVRFRRLFKKGSTCRVIGAHRWYLDWFHWNFSLAWIIVMIELIVGTVPRNPPIRLLSMPLTSMLFVFGTELLLVDTLRYFQVPAPARMSSIPKGAQLRPGIYTLIEDVVAVDGSGGTPFREALNRRYESSHIFRAMLRRLGIFWAVGAEAMAVVCTILIFTINANAAYTIGWSAPFGWAGVWTIFTFWYVKRELRREEKEWTEEAATAKSPARAKAWYQRAS